MRNVFCIFVIKDVVKVGGLFENDLLVDFQVEFGGVYKVVKKCKVLVQVCFYWCL